MTAVLDDAPTAAAPVPSARTTRPVTWALVLGVLSVAVAAWLGYAFGRGQAVGDIARLYRDQGALDFTLDTGQLIAQYKRVGGDLKPLLRLPDGTSLLDYSDWDYSAVVVVDGQRYEFVRLVPTASVDYGRNRIVAGQSSGDWVLSREVTLNGPAADVRFQFLANRPLREVRIAIPHVNWYYLHVDLQSDGFAASVARASRAEIETGAISTPAYEVRLVGTPGGEHVPNYAQLGPTTPFGVQSVVTQYLLRDPPVGQYVDIGTERITWRALP